MFKFKGSPFQKFQHLNIEFHFDNFIVLTLVMLIMELVVEVSLITSRQSSMASGKEEIKDEIEEMLAEKNNILKELGQIKFLRDLST